MSTSPKKLTNKVRRLSVFLTFAATLVMAGWPNAAAADPGGDQTGDAKTYGRQIESVRTKLPPGKAKSSNEGGGIQPQADSFDDLGGGVWATSSVGMQWGSNPFGEDVSGFTRSYATAVIDQIHAHGALVREGNADAQNCYEGELEWTPDITRNFQQEATSGWGPYFSGFHDCWVMANGHYYIRNGVRTDTFVPDIIKRF